MNQSTQTFKVGDKIGIKYRDGKVGTIATITEILADGSFEIDPNEHLRGYSEIGLRRRFFIENITLLQEI